MSIDQVLMLMLTFGLFIIAFIDFLDKRK
ncbi:putative holin-like toxin [Camelliibacillus cellulosilyticus]|uniref:Holin-like toxin n=1 Tax=Camelliibacillus cellulosilyticus TaxID=2174486 RepID=A0ABV9GMB8_9BACL